jgi:hypothetical protein
MTRTVRKATVAGAAAGCLALVVVCWIWASILSERLDRQLTEEAVVGSSEPRPPREEEMPLPASPGLNRGLRRARQQLRSWLSRHAAQHQKSNGDD